MKGRRLSTAQQKVAWLLDHQDLWQRAPTQYSGIWLPEFRDMFETLFIQMKAAGLYSTKSYRIDVYGSILNHIQDARRIRRQTHARPASHQ